MTPRRVLIGLLGSLAVFALLVLLTHSVVPEPARAYWTPPEIAKGGGPSDPGTPYEEPEGGGGGGGGVEPGDTSKPPEGIPNMGGQVVTNPQIASRPPVDRSWLLMQLYRWRISFLYLIKF